MQLIRCLISNFYLNMFRASLCPSSGEQDRVLLHIVFCTGCAVHGCVELGRKLCALCEGYCSTVTVSYVHCVKVTVRTVTLSCVHCLKVTVRTVTLSCALCEGCCSNSNSKLCALCEGYCSNSNFKLCALFEGFCLNSNFKLCTV